MRNPREILGVTQNATGDDIHRAYRRRSFELHPDRNPDPNAHEQFLELQVAKTTLLQWIRNPILERVWNTPIDTKWTPQPEPPPLETTLHGYRVTISGARVTLHVPPRRKYIFQYRLRSKGDPLPSLYVRKPPEGLPSMECMLLGDHTYPLLGRSSFLALDVARIDHPETPYILAGGRRRWLLRRDRENPYMMTAERFWGGNRVRLAGYGQFTDEGGKLKTFGERVFPPFEVPI